LCTALFVLGGLFISSSANWRNKVIAPGPLASPHAQLFDSGRDVAKCSTCHAAADESAIKWTASLLSAHSAGPTQSQLCLHCHDKTIEPRLALAAHNLAPEFLEKLTRERARKSQGALASFGKPAMSPGKELACAACHREHHGAEFDLTAMDNAACQACHQQRYASFASDHPDFSDWPHERRTRIRFPHASHRAKHFVEKKVTFDCRNCHVEDAAGDVQLTLSYEATCASCHDEKIATSVARGIPMIALPTLDVEALRDAGHDIGPWPEDASGDFDGRLPPVMRLLLASDPAAARAMIALGESFDFFDVDPTDPEQLAACATLVGAIKQLMHDLGSDGAKSVRERLVATLGGDPAPASVAALMAGLSDDTLRGAAEWLQESAPSLASQSSSTEIPRSVPNLDTVFGPGGTWFRDDATLSIRYRPSAHADPVLASWLQLVARAGLSTQPILDAAFRELADPAAPGLCVSCHSIEQEPGGTLAVNWRSYDRRSESRPFTKFSHGPHLVLPQLADCPACHEVVSTADTGASPYIQLDPHQHVREFNMMPRHKCAECHTMAAAGDRCQSCHSYHVDLGATRMDQ
jgi:hypothetical protein